MAAIIDIFGAAGYGIGALLPYRIPKESDSSYDVRCYAYQFCQKEYERLTNLARTQNKMVYINEMVYIKE